MFLNLANTNLLAELSMSKLYGRWQMFVGIRSYLKRLEDFGEL